MRQRVLELPDNIQFLVCGSLFETKTFSRWLTKTSVAVRPDLPVLPAQAPALVAKLLQPEPNKRPLPVVDNSLLASQNTVTDKQTTQTLSKMPQSQALSDHKPAEIYVPGSPAYAADPAPS